MAQARKGKVLVQGLGDLEKKFRRMVEAAEPKQVQEALLAMGEIIAAEARELAPEGATGRLKESITVRKAGKAGKRGVEVAVTGEAVWYAHLVEFGTKPHWIKTKKTFFGIFRKRWRHPGAAAKPFMRPAYDSKRDEAFEAGMALFRDKAGF